MKSNFNPNIWGPKAWFFIDTIILSYPDYPSTKDKKIYKDFLYQLKDILPCESCRIHYANNLKDIPLSQYYLNSRNNLIEWILKMHNKINVLNNKITINKYDFIQFYKENYNCDIIVNDNNEIKNIKNNNNITLILIVITIFMIYLIYKKIEK